MQARAGPLQCIAGNSSAVYGLSSCPLVSLKIARNLNVVLVAVGVAAGDGDGNGVGVRACVCVQWEQLLESKVYHTSCLPENLLR